MDEFNRLVNNLIEKKINLNIIQMAIRTSIRKRKNFPDEIKDLLCGESDQQPGLVCSQFKILIDTIAIVELAYRRGKQVKLVIPVQQSKPSRAAGRGSHES